MNVFLNIVFGILYVLWRIVHLIFMGVWKLISDVMRGVYGKFVALIVGVVFLALMGGIISLFHLH